MKHFVKGAAVTAAVLIILMIVSIFCNIQGIELNMTAIGPVTAVCSMFIYNGLIKNEEKKKK